jgi:hypothetical protein
MLADPGTLECVDYASCCSLWKDADVAAGYGSLWTNEVSSGTTVRWDAISEELAHVYRVTDPPLYRGNCLTSIALGAGAAWATVAAAHNWPRNICPGRPQ